MNIPFLSSAFITTVSAVISLGFSVAAAFNLANEVRNTALNLCAKCSLGNSKCGPISDRLNSMAIGDRLQHDHRSDL
jgi:hypothetical protein